ncbi:Ger(x)C family spore germination protein [Paenibacillus piri]
MGKTPGGRRLTMSLKWFRRFLIPTSACLFLSFLTGCWSTVELNDQAFAKIMLLDKSDDGIEMTLEFPLPNQMVPSQEGGGGGGGGKSGKPFAYVTKRDRDVAKAYRAIQADLSRKISFGQLRIIVIGRKLAEDGIGQVVDFIAREPKIHINSNVFITEGKPVELASILVGFERFPTDILSGYIEEKVTVEVTVKDLLMANYTGGDLVIPMLVFGREGIVKKKTDEKWMGTDGAAIFKDGKMVSLLNTMEMRGALWILGKLKNAEVNVPSPSDGKNVSFMVTQATTRIKPEVEGDPTIHIRCKAEVDVLANESNINLEDPDQLKLLEQRLGKKLEGRMAQAIAKSKKAKSDAFQFGNYVRWRFPQKWEEIKPGWRELYVDKVNVKEHVDVSIKRLGAVRKAEGQRLLSNQGEQR